MENKPDDLERIDEKQLNLDLFALDPLLDKNYSNTLEVYDLAGKFIYDKRTKYLKEAKASDTKFSRITHLGETKLEITVTAANIERKKKDGTIESAFVFPGTREEIIEDVLRKLITDKNRSEAYDVREDKKSGYKLVGVRFSLYEIFHELKRVGKSYSYPEIRESLEIMNLANLSISSEDKSLNLSAPFFPIKLVADKANPEHTLSFICFHPLVTEIILNKRFRRFNLAQALKFKSSYSRLMYKRLCHRWIQAAPDKPYKILLSTLISAFKAPNSKLFKDKELFVAVMDDLVEANVLSNYELSPKKEGRKILDWVFELYPTDSFAKQQAASNKVENRIKEKDTLPPVYPA